MESQTANSEGKYLTFSLADEEYGIGILKVKEIIGIMEITSIPKVPNYIRGVINLRGKVIPIIDLRLKFGIPEADHTERTCIIVVEVAGSHKQVQMGIVVDSVSEVMNTNVEDIEEAPSFGASVQTEYILGMAKIDNGVRILLEIDRILSGDELEQIASAA